MAGWATIAYRTVTHYVSPNDQFDGTMRGKIVKKTRTTAETRYDADTMPIVIVTN